MKWLKFYGQDFFTDPKIMMLTPGQKLLFIGLLSLAAQEDKNNEAEGILPMLTELTLMQYIGVQYDTEEWESCRQVFDLFEELGLIKRDYNANKLVVINYQKLQKSNLSASERVMKSRKNKQEKPINNSVNTVNVKVNKKLTLDTDIDNSNNINIITRQTAQNPEIDFILEEFKKYQGHIPVDKKPRQVAQNIRQITQSFIKRCGTRYEEQHHKPLEFSYVIDRAFSWFAQKDFAQDTVKLETIKQHMKVYLDLQEQKLKGDKA